MKPAEERLSRATLIKLWAAAFALRLAWAFLSGRMHSGSGWNNDALYDDMVYLDMAKGFMGLGPPMWISHPPGYSFFLAPFLLLGPMAVPAALTVQMALGAAIIPLTCRLAERLKLPKRAAFLAGVLLVLDPMLIYFNARLAAEIPFLFLVLCFFLAWLRAWEKGSDSFAATAGFLGGAATLMRGVILPYGAFLAAVSFWRRKYQPRWTSLVAICGLCWAAALAPWTLRNWSHYHRFVPVSVQGGWNFYEGMTVDLDEILGKRAKAMGEEIKAQGLTDPFQIDAYFGKKANDWVKAHPAEFARLTLRKVFKFWRPFPYPPHSASVRWAVGCFNIALFSLALLGLAFCAEKSPSFIFLAAWAVHLTALHSLFASNLRYRLPLEPLIAIAAATGAHILLSRGRKQ
jgi:4-amino-4-deoxy-L-arabinose transferase-like glycosyltransferase